MPNSARNKYIKTSLEDIAWMKSQTTMVLTLVQYATTNNFKVLSTWYPRKDIYKGTWKIPGTNDANQIDHTLMSKRWATDIENV
jgi:hypothetical protein